MIKSSNQLIKIFLYGLLVLTAIPSIGTLFWWSYPLELFSNFRVYYLLLAGVIAIACFILQITGLLTKLPLYLSLALIAFNSVWIVPWYLPHSQQGSGNIIRVLAFNINIQNEQWDAIANAIRTVKPDIATIIESSSESKQELSERLKNLFPFVYRTSGGGITIFSRFPLISPQTKTFNNGSILVTSLQINQKAVKLIAAHPRIPLKPDLFQRRNASLAEITTYIQQQQPKSLIFLGDLNLTLWSPYYSRLIRKTGLHNTRLGFGIEPSWVEAATHVSYPSWITTLVKIPIDHIFVSQDIKVSDCKTMKAANSDHRMLWSDLVI
jgi:endonuclease/exonuclease/phosphatase (EEP) superfamily protein YafD